MVGKCYKLVLVTKWVENWNRGDKERKGRLRKGDKCIYSNVKVKS